MNRIVVLCSMFLFGLSLAYLPKLKIQNLDKVKTFKVEVKGAVKNPGVYEFESEMIISDLLNEAVLNEDADLSQINQSSYLYPGMVINVPANKDVEESLISINNATIEELCTLPGIGPAMAERIIEYRKTYNGFNNIEDLLNVKGIGTKKYEKIAPYICL